MYVCTYQLVCIWFKYGIPKCFHPKLCNFKVLYSDTLYLYTYMHMYMCTFSYNNVTRIIKNLKFKNGGGYQIMFVLQLLVNNNAYVHENIK